MSKKSNKSAASIVTANDILQSWVKNPKATKLADLANEKLAKARTPEERAAIFKGLQAEVLEHNAAVVEAKAPKAKKAKAPKAEPKVEALNALETRMQSYLLDVAKAHTDAYAKSISRPLADFSVWCASKGITDVKHVVTLALQQYAKHVQARGGALSTARMALARVQTFCRVAGVDADLSTLRLQHTDAEKTHLTELAEGRVEAAAKAERAARKAARAAAPKAKASKSKKAA